MTTTPTYPAGTLAYFDTFAGLIPCRVDDAWSDADGFCEVRVILTATRGAYKRGEILTLNPAHVIPRDRVYVRCGQYRYRGGWSWADTRGDGK